MNFTEYRRFLMRANTPLRRRSRTIERRLGVGRPGAARPAWLPSLAPGPNFEGVVKFLADKDSQAAPGSAKFREDGALPRVCLTGPRAARPKDGKFAESKEQTRNTFGESNEGRSCLRTHRPKPLG